MNPYLRGNSVAEEPGTIHTITFEGIPLQLCYVPQGDFLMGAPRSPLTPRLERPQHVVSISRPILLGQTPITQGFYAALTGYNPSYFEDWEAPLEQVSWREAAEFCNLLSRLDGLDPVYYFRDEEVEVAEEEDDSSSDGGDTLALLAAASRAKRGARKSGGSRGKREEDSSNDDDAKAESTKESGGDALQYDPSQAGETSEDSALHSSEADEVSSERQDESSPKEAISQDVSQDDLDEEHHVLELSAEHEQDPSLDEKRRQILEEGEAELDEKFKRRHQLQRLKEPPILRVWVRCDLNSGGYRLPTEAEWEYAARAGTSQIYPGANQWRDVAWGASPTVEGTQPVARLKPNSWGLYDLGGNVAEWCSDIAVSYEQRPHISRDPFYDALIGYRIIRGGSWACSAHLCRVSSRGSAPPEARGPDIGLRVLRRLDV